MFRIEVLGTESVARVARKLTTAAIRIAVGTQVAEGELARTVEGIVTPLVREEAPVGETGALRAGMGAHVTFAGGTHIVTWTAAAPYADYVLHGTGIYAQPTPHSAWDDYGLQVFTVGGETIFAMHTHHLGSRPNPFAERAEERAEQPVHAAMMAVGEELLMTFHHTFEGAA